MVKPSTTYQIAIVDDHQLFRKGLTGLVEMIDAHFSILFEAGNGYDLQQKLNSKNLPDIILMDINMPGMDGFETVAWLNKNYPDIKVLVISMIEKEESIVRMLRLGVKGYLSKDIDPIELQNALNSIINQGFYYTDFITGKLIHSLQNGNAGLQKNNSTPEMNDREKTFLQYACSELTYNEIAGKMFLSSQNN